MVGQALCQTLSFHSQTIPHSITNNGCEVKIMAAEFKQWLRVENNGWEFEQWLRGCDNDRSAQRTATYVSVMSHDF